ncbi:6 kDa hypothetical protein [Pelargonium chlorotic ring pattern virus]|uniref:Uncharacterized protein n=1 Tax=Pelargonium chlorotic ring pattern virus TaxID=167021 RepID=Q6EN24_9TOMB|nr:6 kDa hypothetical protein [Pelargonium chlorotic ring pattern virus]AAT69553.1 6 kDa hypothetical protein [Pelargonium chlorotic ring pattern virus]
MGGTPEDSENCSSRSPSCFPNPLSPNKALRFSGVRRKPAPLLWNFPRVASPALTSS